MTTTQDSDQNNPHNTTEEKILELTDFWMNYVTKDHHKDRDCHWYIEIDYKYGQKPVYQAYHSGYIADHITGDYRDSLEEAQTDLLALIHQAIHEEKKWAREVLKDPSEWDEWQIEKAKMITEVKL